MIRCALIGLVASTLFSSHALSEVLVCEQLIDVRSGTLASWQAIVIEGERIQSVMDESDLPGDVTVTTRLEDQTCMPGLMDMHVHIISESSPDGFTKQFRWNPADYAYGSVKFAERTLMAGFTPEEGSLAAAAACWPCSAMRLMEALSSSVTDVCSSEAVAIWDVI